MSPITDTVPQNTRKPKWEWQKHFPGMLKLYHDGLTIPQIHVAIQCNNFTPSLRTVYKKFNDEGYSTGHGRESKSYPAASAEHIEACDIAKYEECFPVAVSESLIPAALISLPIRSHMQMAAANVSSMQSVETPSNRFTKASSYDSPSSWHLQSGIAGEDLTAPDSVDSAGRTSVLMESMTAPHTSDRIPSDDIKIGRIPDRKKRKVSNTTETELSERNLPYASGGRTRHIHRAREDTRLYRTFRKICSLTALSESKKNVSKAQGRESSLFSDNDSGYQSGRGTPSTFRMRESLVSHPESLTESQELYKVVCLQIHGHPLPEQYGEKQPCLSCGFSSIHNLAWLAPRLTLQEFLAELKSEKFYDLQAIDAAGNSALHHAAASGASCDHLEALIDAGVPLDQRNTAGQNFLHCLRPCWSESYSPDCFRLGLIKLLDLVEPKAVFGQQDNDGQTVLHVLASHITEPKLKEETFKKFTESGYPDIILDRFGNYAMSQHEPRRMEQPILEELDEDDTVPSDDPDWWKENINYPEETVNDTMRATFPDLEASGTLEQEDIACHALVNAFDNPHSFDWNTKDTILHVLSRFNVHSRGSSGSNEMIKRLRYFVSRGVSLNWHNNEGQTPLTAFICNQKLRGDETGATLAKYMDIFIWKWGKWKADKEGGRNNINIDMMNRRGATALHEASVGAHFPVVCTLIQAGANVNARLGNDPRGLSVLQATYEERAKLILPDPVRHFIFTEIISELEHHGAVRHPTSMQERGQPTFSS